MRPIVLQVFILYLTATEEAIAGKSVLKGLFTLALSVFKGLVLLLRETICEFYSLSLGVLNGGGKGHSCKDDFMRKALKDQQITLHFVQQGAIKRSLIQAACIHPYIHVKALFDSSIDRANNCRRLHLPPEYNKHLFKNCGHEVFFR